MCIRDRNKGNTLPQIRESLNITTAELDELLSKLIDEELINANNELTEKGTTEAKQNEVFVVYKYAKRNDVKGDSILDTTRDFCSNLVTQSKTKSWTREDINALNNGQLPNVFLSRGGFYNNPETGVTTPFCRHVWQQRLVRLK